MEAQKVDLQDTPYDAQLKHIKPNHAHAHYNII